MSQAGMISSGGGGGVVETLTSDSGVATAVANNIDVVGGTNIGTTAAGDTLTVNLDSVILMGNGTDAAPVYSFSGSTNSGWYYRAGTGPTVTNGGSDVMRWGFTIATFNIIETFNGLTYSRQTINSTPTNVSSSAIFVSVDTSTLAITVRLPNAPRENQVFYVKDQTGNAGANNITVTTVGGAVNIDGATTYVMSVNYMSAGFLFNGSTYEVF